MCMPEKNEENNVRTENYNPADDLRKFCKNLKDERIGDVKEVLKKYFESQFLKDPPRPWKAIEGKKKCKPMPIHRIIWFKDPKSDYFYQWPNIPKEIIYQELKNLGFNVIVYENGNILLTVEPWKSGEKLTFAQEWVKKINQNYSKYCASEIKIAKELYPEYIKQLLSTPKEKVKIFEGYTLFEDFKFDRSVSRKCANYMIKLLAAQGIESVYENRNYKGVKVLNIEKLTKEEDKND